MYLQTIKVPLTVPKIIYSYTNKWTFQKYNHTNAMPFKRIQNMHTFIVSTNNIKNNIQRIYPYKYNDN